MFVSLWYYDEVYMLVKAMQTAGTTSANDRIVKALEKIRWDGAIGKSCFTDDKVINSGADVALVSGGKVKWAFVPVDLTLCKQ